MGGPRGVLSASCCACSPCLRVQQAIKAAGQSLVAICRLVILSLWQAGAASMHAAQGTSLPAETARLECSRPPPHLMHSAATLPECTLLTPARLCSPFPTLRLTLPPPCHTNALARRRGGRGQRAGRDGGPGCLPGQAPDAEGLPGALPVGTLLCRVTLCIVHTGVKSLKQLRASRGGVHRLL